MLASCHQARIFVAEEIAWQQNLYAPDTIQVKYLDKVSPKLTINHTGKWRRTGWKVDGNQSMASVQEL